LLAAGLAALFIAGEAIRLGIATSLEDSANPTELRWKDLPRFPNFAGP
jgi:hypothetical protein